MQHRVHMNEPTMTSHLQLASRVRAARSADLREIVELIDRASEVPIDADDVDDLIRAGHLIVLEVVGDIRRVASVRIERHRGHLGFLVLDAALEGEGFEVRMRAVASALCTARGCRAMELQ